MARVSERVPQAASVNPGVIEIEDPSVFMRVVAISDVHGMYAPLLGLLSAGKVTNANGDWIAGSTLLIVIGDSIDKGPQSLEVLNLWTKLQEQSAKAGGRLVHLLGNHEAEFLADPKNDKKASELLDELRAQKIPVSDLTSFTTPRGSFLHAEPLALKVGNWLFFHSGFYPEMDWNLFVGQARTVLSAADYGNDFMIGKDSVLEKKDWEKDEALLATELSSMDAIGVYGIAFGHQPEAFHVAGRSAAKANGRLIKIDNGMAPEAGSHPGSLLVFTSPAQLKLKKYPDVQVVLPGGSIRKLVPE
ncbi:MAG: metallophosphoesterase [Bdellovibrionaceae bacterium]|nr:metallophosphoesterase [Pseudobdellovibrionaceae bacterium]